MLARRIGYFMSAVIFILLVGSDAAEEPTDGYPEALATFLYKVSGDYRYTKETTDEDGNPVVIYYNLTFIPVKAPGFTDPTIIMVDSKPGATFRFLWTVFQDSNNFLHGYIYSVTEADIRRSHKSDNGALYLPSDADIKRLENCKVIFDVDTSGAFQGSWQDCMEFEGVEEPILLIRNGNCDSLTHVLDVGTSTEVYTYVRQGERYPQPPETEKKMKSTKNPCQA